MKKVSKNKIATAYADAWFNVAKDQKMEDVVLEEAKILQSSLQNDSTLWSVLFAPTENNNDLISFITDFSKKAKLSVISTDVLKLLAANHRLGLLNLVVDEFFKLYYAEHNIIEVHVDTVVPLSKTQDALLNKTLAKKLNAQILIHYHIRPEVLGGLNIRFNSFQINDTLAHKLDRIKLLMLSGEV